MNKLRKLLLLNLLMLSQVRAQTAFEINQAHEKRISKVIKNMTLEEKVGQTCQITLDAVLKSDASGQTIKPIEIDAAKLKEAFGMYKIGSILNVSSHTLTRQQWTKILSDIKRISQEENLKIPIIYGIDAIHGANYTVGATLFPQEIGLAATWNPALAYDFGRITAYEVRATGLDWNFSPVLDLGRQPLWSRFFETLGEDAFLAGEMGTNIVYGYQGKTKIDAYHVAACLKHFVGYSAPLSGRDRTPAWIPQKYMTELYLPAFKAAVDAGAMTLMINSGDVNGVPGHANKYLLTDLLKKKWAFRGFTVSDWEDFIMLQSVHNVSSSLQEAVILAFNAGVDMSMVPNSPQYKEYCGFMLKAIRDKSISKKRLDDAVRRILRVKMAMNLFEPAAVIEYPLFASQEFQQKAYQSAVESITLLKNRNQILPLTKEAKVLVAGPTANNLIFQNGAWTHTWQGADTNFNTPSCKTVYQAIQDEIGSENCLYSMGAKLMIENGWEETKWSDTNDFKQKAAQADVIVLCLGEMPATEKPGDIRSLNLSVEQIELAEMAYRSGKPVVLVLLEGRPRIIEPIVEEADGILQCYLPGDYGALALSDILFGKANPSGKLPYTYPKYDGVIEHYDRPKSVDRSGKTNQFDAFDPAWEFGFGLSYTQFEYANLVLSKTKMGEKEQIEVKVTVRNIGSRDGQEVVQLYVSDQVAQFVPAGKKLRGFQKISLKSGESQTVSFVINAEDLKYSDEKGDWILEKGTFGVSIGQLKQTFELY